MSIENVTHLGDRTIISVLQPTHFGAPDDRWTITISHESPTMPHITRQDLDKLLSEAPFGIQNTSDNIDVPGLGTVVFINEYDNDYSSANWRAGVHKEHLSCGCQVRDPCSSFVQNS